MSAKGNSQADEKERRIIPPFYGKLFAIGIVACAIVFIGTWSIYTILYRGPVEAVRGLKNEFFTGASDGVKFAENVGRQIRDALQMTPKVTINGVTVFGENEPILELATIERKFSVRYEWTHSWLGSEKVLEIEGVVLAKAGFNLREPFTIAVDPKTRQVRATMPPAKILSLEILDYRILKDDNGWWNKITDQDREEALKGLLLQARMNVRNSGMLKEVMKTSEERISEIVRLNGGDVIFVKVGQKEKP